MLLTFKNKAGNNVAVKAIDIKSIVEMEKDGETVCQLFNYDTAEEMPRYYVSVDTFVELRNNWQIALQAWNNSKVG